MFKEQGEGFPEESNVNGEPEVTGEKESSQEKENKHFELKFQKSKNGARDLEFEKTKEWQEVYGAVIDSNKQYIDAMFNIKKSLEKGNYDEILDRYKRDKISDFLENKGGKEAYRCFDEKWFNNQSDENLGKIQEFMRYVKSGDFSNALSFYQAEKENKNLKLEQTERTFKISNSDDEIERALEKEITPEKAMKAIKKMIEIYNEDIKMEQRLDGLLTCSYGYLHSHVNYENKRIMDEKESFKKVFEELI